ncbi:hypothetical protein HU200_048630 [Digitaria exilis]|uniref:laccase n=1 Tax=Digitaria exilis TaxID=1010633 RepID=A0A835AUP4_9POAL|nr:hypothetical protein HU200_048630 [Digitaria exilis]
MTHLCKETLVAVVNGQLPGPAIEVREGDTVAINVINKSRYNITIHWHGVKQRLNCWADGVPMITQCPILPNHSMTYRFNVTGQEGTLWWHSHVPSLRATVHGALIIRPRHGAASYPFVKPHREIPVIVGDWWQMDLVQLNKELKNGTYEYNATVAATINGKLGDVHNCSGKIEDGYVLEVEPGKTYLLRIINAALTSEYYFKIAGHRFTVVAADANYVNPYTTDVIAIAPGETVDALLVADASPAGSYYMVAQDIQPPITDYTEPKLIARGTVRYQSSNNGGEDEAPSSSDVPMAPEMPGLHDRMVSFYFHGNLTSQHRRSPVPTHVDDRLFVTLSAGSVCRHGQSCKRRGNIQESIILVTMNDVSFLLPTAAAAAPLLESHYYYGQNKTATGGGVDLHTLPDRPRKKFNFTDSALIHHGPKEERLEPTERAATARRFRHGATVEVVFQSTAVMQSHYNPMHLHGHDMFVLAQGLGNYDAARDVARYNVVDPPVKNTVLVPSLGWAAVWFVADNPGVWYLHCHYEYHASMGMATVFIVDDGTTADSTLPPPPADLPKCGHNNNLTPNELNPHVGKSDVSYINIV